MFNKKPIAWRAKLSDCPWVFFESKPQSQESKTLKHWDVIEPLYGKETFSLTEEQFDTLQKAKRAHLSISGFISELEAGNYPALTDIYLSDSENQIALISLFAEFDINHPDKSVTIIPDPQYFVEIETTNEDHKYLSVGEVVSYYATKETATGFDLESDASEYLIPHTKTVLLPVTGEK